METKLKRLMASKIYEIRAAVRAYGAKYNALLCTTSKRTFVQTIFNEISER